MSIEYKSPKVIMEPRGKGAPRFSPNIGAKEPLAHPCNCKHECPYGYNKAFCFPCMAKIMADHREKKKEKQREVYAF